VRIGAHHLARPQDDVDLLRSQYQQHRHANYQQRPCVFDERCRHEGEMKAVLTPEPIIEPAARPGYQSGQQNCQQQRRDQFLAGAKLAATVAALMSRPLATAGLPSQFFFRQLSR